MNDQQVGAAFRAIRIRKRLRQVDVATMTEVSTATISRIERGHFDALSLSTLRHVAVGLDIKLEIVARWRGADLDRVVNARHAALHESVARAFGKLRGWEVRPEVSFAIYGERGIVDVLAWHAGTRAQLVIELKTEIVDVNELIGSIDRKRRLAPVMARDLGWSPRGVSVWVVVVEGRTTRRRIAEHRALLRAAFPAAGKAVNEWLLAPDKPIAALSTWSVMRSSSRMARPSEYGRARSSPRLEIRNQDCAAGVRVAFDGQSGWRACSQASRRLSEEHSAPRRDEWPVPAKHMGGSARCLRCRPCGSQAPS